MIKAWLIKYWWVNEMGKLFVALGFGFFAYLCWEASKIIEANIGVFVVGFSSGIMAMLSLFVLVDIGAVLLAKIRAKVKWHKGGCRGYFGPWGLSIICLFS